MMEAKDETKQQTLQQKQTDLTSHEDTIRELRQQVAKLEHRETQVRLHASLLLP